MQVWYHLVVADALYNLLGFALHYMLIAVWSQLGLLGATWVLHIMFNRGGPVLIEWDMTRTRQTLYNVDPNPYRSRGRVLGFGWICEDLYWFDFIYIFFCLWPSEWEKPIDDSCPLSSSDRLRQFPEWAALLEDWPCGVEGVRRLPPQRWHGFLWLCCLSV